MNIKIKKLIPEAIIPTYAKEGDAGLDLTATSKDWHIKFTEYGTGLAIEIPEDYVGLIFPRSSVSNRDLMLKNAVGVIDSGYRGELKLRFARIPIEFEYPFEQYEIGEKIGQLIIIPRPHINLIVVDDLSSSERGVGGFGHTGNYAKQVLDSPLHYNHNNY